MTTVDQAFQAVDKFHPMGNAELQALLSRTAAQAAGGMFEPFKTTSILMAQQKVRHGKATSRSRCSNRLSTISSAADDGVTPPPGDSSTVLASLLALIRKAPDGRNAFAKRLQKRVTPAERKERRGFLIELFVGLREESHLLPISITVFVNRDSKFDRSIALLFFDGIEVELSELFSGLR
jgi:hypothetical protein